MVIPEIASKSLTVIGSSILFLNKAAKQTLELLFMNDEQQTTDRQTTTTNNFEKYVYLVLGHGFLKALCTGRDIGIPVL